MGDGYTVRAGVLQANSQAATRLRDYCQAVAADAVRALAVMSGSAGHQGLASALTAAASRGDRTFAGMLAAYDHAAQGLAVAGRQYVHAEQASAAGATSVRPHGMQ